MTKKGTRKVMVILIAIAMAMVMAIDAIFALNNHMYPLEVYCNLQLWEILFLRIRRSE